MNFLLTSLNDRDGYELTYDNKTVIIEPMGNFTTIKSRAISDWVRLEKAGIHVLPIDYQKVYRAIHAHYKNNLNSLI